MPRRTFDPTLHVIFPNIFVFVLLYSVVFLIDVISTKNTSKYLSSYVLNLNFFFNFFSIDRIASTAGYQKTMLINTQIA
jgi:hypothetical protein